MVKELLIHGNLKMGPNVYLFNLPPGDTCTPTDWCLHGRNGKPRCYAFRNNFKLPSVIKSMYERFELSKQPDFADRMSDEIHKKKVEFFRWQSSGDCYRKEYVESLIEIAKNCPETLFRTTTRRRDLTSVLQELNSRPNFIVRESLDSERPEPTMGLPFTALSHMAIAKTKGIYSCPDDCPKCGYYCWNHRDNIKFDEF